MFLADKVRGIDFKSNVVGKVVSAIAFFRRLVWSIVRGTPTPNESTEAQYIFFDQPSNDTFELFRRTLQIALSANRSSQHGNFDEAGRHHNSINGIDTIAAGLRIPERYAENSCCRICSVHDPLILLDIASTVPDK